MKKIIAIAAIMLMILSVFTACGNKEESASQTEEATVTEEAASETSALSGEYKLTKTIYEGEESDVPEDQSESIVFKDDGSLVFNTRDIPGDLEEATVEDLQDVSYDGKYTVSGSTVNIKFKAIHGDVDRDYSIDGDSLTYTDTENGVTMIYTKAN